MAGFLTSKQIWGCTTFDDHVSDYIYIHLMKNFTTNETLFAKLAFKKLCTKADCSVKHYQADNGQFPMSSLLSAIISIKPLRLAELVHTIKMELSKTETNS